MAPSPHDSSDPLTGPVAGAAPQESFGYEAVAPSDRQQRVNEVFAAVAERYDLMNDLMSGGLHRLWKDDLVAMLSPPRTSRDYRHIDVAGGTGDVAFRIAAATETTHPIVIADLSPEMLAVGQRRAGERGLAHRLAFVTANAETLPFADRSFDAYTIAFGIRNVTHIARALKEAFRVLRLGGRFLCLEFSRVEVPLLDRAYDLHSFEVIPRLGALVTGDEKSYRYLVESIRRFPAQEAFSALIRAEGFERVSHRNLSGGIAAIHSGWKL